MNCFQNIAFGDCEIQQVSNFLQDLLVLQEEFAVEQLDIGLIANFPFQMQVHEGPQIKP